jgi:hypothetical protein
MTPKPCMDNTAITLVDVETWIECDRALVETSSEVQALCHSCFRSKRRRRKKRKILIFY